MNMESIEKYTVDGIDIHIPTKKLAEICTGYIYIKALRNRINHASDRDFSDIQEQILLSRGYSPEYDIDVISANILRYTTYPFNEFFHFYHTFPFPLYHFLA